MGAAGSYADRTGVPDSAGRVLLAGHRLRTQLTRTEAIGCVASAVVVALHVWLYRFDMVNLDGISYLELGWAWHDGRWSDAINGYWSPLYPMIIAGALALASPSPYWEYPLVHAVNGVSALAALAAFTYLVRGFGWTSRAAVAAAYGLFLWSAIALLVAWMESPDMLLAAWVYLAAGALVRIVSGRGTTSTWLLFGGALALAYLTKSVMLPIALAFFAAAALTQFRGTAPRQLAAAVLVFAVGIAPWIVTLSATKGRLTFGDSGRLNYVWFVNGSEDWPRNWPKHWPHWSGEAANGVGTQAAQVVHTQPAVYAFATPIAGTYPLWYDPSWWYEGVQTHFDPVDQFRRLKISGADLYRVFALNPYNHDFFNPQPALLIALVLVAVLTRRLTGTPAFHPRLALWLPPMAALALYAAVYVEPRYLGAFVALLWLFAIDALTPARTAIAQTVFRTGMVAMTVTLAGAIVAATWVETYPSARRLLRGEPDREHLAWATAERIRQAGVNTGDPIALAGNSQVATRWAHLLRTPIVAEVHHTDAWTLWDDAAAQDDVAQAFAEAGARWFLLDQPAGDVAPGASRIDGTPFVLRALR